jgi:hypothetical protein
MAAEHPQERAGMGCGRGGERGTGREGRMLLFI